MCLGAASPALAGALRDWAVACGYVKAEAQALQWAGRGFPTADAGEGGIRSDRTVLQLQVPPTE